MNREYKHADFGATVYGTVAGKLYDGREGYREFERHLSGRSLVQVIRDQCSKDFDGGGKVVFGVVEVTYHVSDTRRIVRDFDLSMFPSIAKYVDIKPHA